MAFTADSMLPWPGNHDDLRVDLHLPQSASVASPSRPGSHTSSTMTSNDLAHDTIEALFAALDGVDVVAFVAQHAAERRSHAGLVVDDQNRCFIHRCSLL